MGYQRTFNVKLKRGRNVVFSIEQYNSSDELVKESANRAIRYGDYEITNTKIHKKPDFYGVANYDEAMELLKLGYQPTVDKLKLSLKANPKNMDDSKRVKFENNIHGFAPVVPLAMMGVPNSMINTSVRPMKYKVIDVYYDISVHYGIHANRVIEAGQTLLSTVLDLERQGYRFNLYAVQGFSNHLASHVDMLCVKVKSSDRPFDIKRMSFPLTHPAMFRVVGFDWQGKSPITQYNGSGRGMTITDALKSDASELIQETLGKNAVYIPCAKIVSTARDNLEKMLIQ